jgi:hypothetical protein
MSENITFETLVEVGKYTKSNGDELRVDWIKSSNGHIKLNIRSWWTGNDGVLRPSQYPEKGIPDADFDNFMKLMRAAKKVRPAE